MAYPFLTAAKLHQNRSPETAVSRILTHNGFHGQISAQEPALTGTQQKKCVKFPKAHSLQQGWTVEKLQKVDISDESFIELQRVLSDL